ncbi:MAG TPA: hypothetical protein IAB38_00130 [Candidatus Onthousia excrementipullorum]|uniref:Uncharacterized protein n=1 Tax=Candidatus Onthousia excrementipullorum TaxID=2840884 RepID=A0A9D1DSX5_9FIRM|nr:hypothetical protein [Candidatus Onthousia excrementipullorum]
MSKRKMNSLMLGQAMLFGIIIIFFGFIIVREKVPSIKSKTVEEDINTYYEENYKGLDVSRGDLKYSKDDNSYSITYYNKDYEELNFAITSINNKITDNYKENYVKGKEVLRNASKEVLDKYKEIFKNTNFQNIKIEFKDLDKYSKAEAIDILEGNIYNTGYYSVSYYVKVDSLDDVYLNNLINSFNSIALSNGLNTNNYSVTFDNNGIIKIVEGGDFNE